VPVKEWRQRFLRDLVARETLETQEQVAAALMAAGFHVTQATVSRDIRDLQLLKVPTGDGRHRYQLPPATGTAPPEARLDRVLSEVYRSLQRAGNLLVLKVLPGNAHAVGFILDLMTVEGLLGTIAGDDTLLLVTTDEAAAQRIQEMLRPSRPPVALGREGGS